MQSYGLGRQEDLWRAFRQRIGVIGGETPGSNSDPSHKYPVTVEAMMAELLNLRAARKQAKRRQSDQLAHAKRLAHGRPTHLRKLDDAQQSKASRDLDSQRIQPGDGR